MTDSTGGTDGTGFTVVELIVAVLVLAVGILGLTATVGVVGWNMRVSHLQTQVRASARAQMERLLAADRDSLVSGVLQQPGAQISWQVTGVGPRQVWLVARKRIGQHEATDTLVTLVSDR
jgi:Tfp pilus assembly protein PilV